LHEKTSQGGVSAWGQLATFATEGGVLARTGPGRFGYGDGVLTAGDKAPAFTLLDQSGAKVKLSDFKGRKVLVYFYPKG
jgi:cytochrome oxidase Cu insertion factor (SCO1/SenC/PrrC family)